MSRELIPDPSMSVDMATVSIVGVGDGWSSPCPGHRSSREGARNDDPRVVVANSSLNALGEVPGGSGNRPEVFIGQGQPFVGFNTPGNDKNGIVGPVPGGMKGGDVVETGGVEVGDRTDGWMTVGMLAAEPSVKEQIE